MYVGTYYNSYYNSVYGDKGSAGSIYGRGTRTGGAGNLALQSLLSGAGGKNSIYNQSAFGSDALKYVQTIKSSGAALGGALRELSSGKAFRQQGIVSSDKAVLTAQEGGTKTGQTAKTVQVDQVAAAQVDTGAALKAGAASGISGQQQVAVEVGGKVSQVSFNAKAGETNQQLQQRMADAINARGIGVTASVTTDSKAGTSQLVLTGDETGAQNGFELMSVSGGAFEALGMGNTTQKAQDAVYRLDGGPSQTSAGNTVSLGGGVTATLKAASDEAVSITRGIDSDYAIGKAEAMAKQYNALYGAALGNESDSRANRLFSDLVSNSRTYTAALAKVGIGFDESGYMKVDKEQMSKAAEDGSLEQFFTQNAGKNYGFQNQLGRVADRAVNNTNRYASPTSFSSGGMSSLSGDSYANSIATLLGGLSGNGGGNSAMGWLFDFKV